MSTSEHDGLEDDIEIFNVSEVDLSVTELTNAIRVKLLADARRLSSLFGRSAQRRKPAQPPTRRIN